MSKTCNLCKEDLLIDKNWTLAKANKSVFICKDCQTARVRSYDANPEHFLQRAYSSILSRCEVEPSYKDFSPTFNLDWFKTWAKNQTSFLQLHEAWLKSNYDTNLKPSVDRINPDQGYTTTNIQYITWKENKLRTRRLGKKKTHSQYKNVVKSRGEYIIKLFDGTQFLFFPGSYATEKEAAYWADQKAIELGMEPVNNVKRPDQITCNLLASINDSFKQLLSTWDSLDPDTQIAVFTQFKKIKQAISL